PPDDRSQCSPVDDKALGDLRHVLKKCPGTRPEAKLQTPPVRLRHAQMFPKTCFRHAFKVLVSGQHPRQILWSCARAGGGSSENCGLVIGFHGNSPFRRRKRIIRSLWRFTSSCCRATRRCVIPSTRAKLAVSRTPSNLSLRSSLSVGLSRAANMAACFSLTC